MKPIDPEKTEIALGIRGIDIRTLWRTWGNTPEQELRLTKAYWLQTIQPHIAGRKLYGVEFFIADEARDWLRLAAESATNWNKSEGGKKAPIPAETFPEWEKEEFRWPEELFADENLKPEILAEIAAPLIKAARENMSPTEAVRTAHELLMAAKGYIGTLPRHEQKKTGSVIELLELWYSRVTFEEILRSNEKDSRQLPLLPPAQLKRNEGRLTMNALKTAVKRFLEERNPTKEPNPLITQEDYERLERQWEQTVKKSEEDKAAGEQSGTLTRLGNGRCPTYQEWQKLNRDSINEILGNKQISFRILSSMRWERFKNHWLNQQSKTQKRESFDSKRATKSRSQTVLPRSAASSPTTAEKDKR